MPELHHVGLCGSAYRYETLRPLCEERQDMRQVEHARPRILPRYVEVRKVMHRRSRRQRIPRADAPVCRAYDEPVELAPMAPYPERQHEEVPEHRKHWGSWVVELYGGWVAWWFST